MINGQNEIWISTGNKSNNRRTIIAVSNCGRIMRKNGEIEIASHMQFVSVGEKRMRVYHFLANNFIAKTEDDMLKQRNVIDHITHTPTNMYINDVRNLRWCTQQENCNFPEAKAAKIGKKHSEETKAKMSAAKTGEKHHMYGKTHSEETKAKISAAKKGRKFTAEHRAKISAAGKGRKFTEEHRAKLSAARKGRKYDKTRIS